MIQNYKLIKFQITLQIYSMFSEKIKDFLRLLKSSKILLFLFYSQFKLFARGKFQLILSFCFSIVQFFLFNLNYNSKNGLIHPFVYKFKIFMQQINDKNLITSCD